MALSDYIPKLTTRAVASDIQTRLKNAESISNTIVSLTAAGSRKTVKAYSAIESSVNTGARKRQNAAWDFYHCMPEVSAPANYQGVAFQRMRWFIGREGPDGTIIPVSRKGDVSAAEEEALNFLKKSLRTETGGGIKELASAYAVQQFVSGESVLVQYTSKTKGGRFWAMLSYSDMRKETIGGTTVRTMHPDDSAAYTLKPNDPVVFFTTPDKQYRRQPYSTIFPLLELLEDLRMIQAAQAISDRSRAASAGIFFIPQEWEMPSTMTPGGKQLLLAERLMEAAEQAVSDPTHPSATIPVFVEVAMKDQALRPFHMRFETPDDQMLNSKYDRLIQRIAVGIGAPNGMVTGDPGNHWCVDDKTEILTRSGWKSYDCLSVGEEVYTLNHETGFAEWQPVQDIATFDVVDETMLSIEGKTHSSLSTMNHRWPVLKKHESAAGIVDHREIVVSSELNNSCKILAAAKLSSFPTEEKWSSEFVNLVSWVWTEGTVGVRPGRDVPRIMFSQSISANPEKAAQIENSLRLLYGPKSDNLGSGGRGSAIETIPKWTFKDRANGIREYKVNSVVARELMSVMSTAKVVDTGFLDELTEEQLSLFVATSIAADGNVKGARRIFFQKDEDRLFPFLYACALLGLPVTDRVVTFQGFHEHEMHRIQLLTRDVIKPDKTHLVRKNAEEVSYSGVVWCPVTDNTTWYARRNGTHYFTGNSAWLSSEEGYTVHIAPGAEQFANDFTRLVLWPALRLVKENGARKFTDDEIEELCLYFDPSDFIIRPNNLEHIRYGHSVMAVSDSSFRDKLGLNDSDAPNEEEIAKRMAQAGLVYQSDKARERPRVSADRVEKGVPDRPSSLEEQMAVQIATATETWFYRARERAGSRVRNKVGDGTEIGLAIKSVSNLEVWDKVTRPTLDTYGISMSFLLSGSTDGLRPIISKFTTPTVAAVLIPVIEELYSQNFFSTTSDIYSQVYTRALQIIRTQYT